MRWPTSDHEDGDRTPLFNHNIVNVLAAAAFNKSDGRMPCGADEHNRASALTAPQERVLPAAAGVPKSIIHDDTRRWRRRSRMNSDGNVIDAPISSSRSNTQHGFR